MIQYYNFNKAFNKLDDYEDGCWINVISPDTSEIKSLGDKFSVPDYFFKDISDTEERPRIDRDEGWLYAVVRVPFVTKDDDGDNIYGTVPMAMMFNEKVFITTYYKDNDVIGNFIRWKKHRNLDDFQYSNLFLALFFEIAFLYLRYLKQINAIMKKAEKRIREKMNQDSLERMMDIEKCLVYFISSMRDNEAVLMKVKRYFSKMEYDEDVLEDVEVEFHQAITTANIYSTILEHDQTSYSSIINNNLNHTMKNMTAVTICLMCAALVPGFYGMNLINGMETWVFGWPVAVGLTVLFGVAGYFICRKFRVF